MDRHDELATAIRLMLTEARQEQGLSQREIAARVGTSQSHLSHLEGGLCRPTLILAIRWADALGHELVTRLRRQERSKVGDP